MNKYLLAVIFSLSLFSYGCNRLTDWFCGPLNEKQQSMIESSNAICNDKCKIEYIPCEYNYVKLYTVSHILDSILIEKVHEKLYESKTKEGWPSIMIYDSQGSYIISHGYNGNFYKQTGD